MTTIDLVATSTDSRDVVDFSQYDQNVYLSSSRSGSTPGVALYRDKSFSESLGYAFTNFNTLILGDSDNKVDLHSSDNPYLTTLQTGNGNNIITSDNVNLTINLGTGKNIVGQLGKGTTVNAHGGHNSFMVSDDVLLTGLTPTDQILADGILLRGVVGFIGSEDPWIVGPNGTKYGLNQLGDLLIQDTAGDTTFVANYQGGPDLPTDQQTAGIFVGRAGFYAERLLDLLNDPHPDNIQKTFKIGNELLYVRTGMKFFNADPLVFDLSGTGIDLTAQSEAAPMLDMRGNGFAVHTGWVGASNGILVLEQAGSSGTPTITQMFGGSGAQGFAALAAYDSNGDGVIDANDPIYSQLRLWVDSNHNGAVEAGEALKRQS